MVPHQELQDTRIEPDDLIAFADDDDWFSPHVFAAPASEHGAKWLSIRLGRMYAVDFDYGRNSLLAFRPKDKTVYTNNYAVTGVALAAVGREALFEHSHAQKTFDEGGFRPAECDTYLSCANKSPASAVSARFLLSQDSFRNDPLAEFARFSDYLGRTKVPDEHGWLAEPLGKLRTLLLESVDPFST